MPEWRRRPAPWQTVPPPPSDRGLFVARCAPAWWSSCRPSAIAQTACRLRLPDAVAYLRSGLLGLRAQVSARNLSSALCWPDSTHRPCRGASPLENPDRLLARETPATFPQVYRPRAAALTPAKWGQNLRLRTLCLRLACEGPQVRLSCPLRPSPGFPARDHGCSAHAQPRLSVPYSGSRLARSGWRLRELTKSARLVPVRRACDE